VEEHEREKAGAKKMVEVTKCPPGIAKGAGDLHAWASRRLVGRSGLPEPKRRKSRTKGNWRRKKGPGAKRRAEMAMAKAHRQMFG
jgi:hypothetical protein